ncbi:hypothetical protein A7982_13333 [Minicystis rosea]|nr:hypothetical protein A7982_13333 [Minicystis rosea]
MIEAFRREEAYPRHRGGFESRCASRVKERRRVSMLTGEP